MKDGSDELVDFAKSDTSRADDTDKTFDGLLQSSGTP